MSNNVVPSRMKIHTDEVRQVIFSHDDATIYTSADDGQIIKWTGKGKFMGKIDQRSEPVYALTISADDRYLTGLSQTGIVYDTNTKQALPTFK